MKFSTIIATVVLLSSVAGFASDNKSCVGLSGAYKLKDPSDASAVSMAIVFDLQKNTMTMSSKGIGEEPTTYTVDGKTTHRKTADDYQTHKVECKNGSLLFTDKTYSLVYTPIGAFKGRILDSSITTFSLKNDELSVVWLGDEGNRVETIYTRQQF